MLLLLLLWLPLSGQGAVVAAGRRDPALGGGRRRGKRRERRSTVAPAASVAPGLTLEKAHSQGGCRSWWRRLVRHPGLPVVRGLREHLALHGQAHVGGDGLVEALVGEGLVHQAQRVARRRLPGRRGLQAPLQPGARRPCRGCGGPGPGGQGGRGLVATQR